MLNIVAIVIITVISSDSRVFEYVFLQVLNLTSKVSIPDGVLNVFTHARTQLQKKYVIADSDAN